MGILVMYSELRAHAMPLMHLRKTVVEKVEDGDKQSAKASTSSGEESMRMQEAPRCWPKTPHKKLLTEENKDGGRNEGGAKSIPN